MFAHIRRISDSRYLYPPYFHSDSCSES